MELEKLERERGGDSICIYENIEQIQQFLKVRKGRS